MNVTVAKSETMMLSAVNDVPVKPAPAGFQVKSGRSSADALEVAKASAAANSVRLNSGSRANW